MNRRIGAAIPPEVEKDVDFLKSKGYSDSEIVREGIRQFANVKRREASA
jgi:hypothetical protein